MPFVQCNEINIYYETRGAGPRLLYVGGTGGDLRRAPNAFTTGYHEQFEVLGYDQRGMGRTDKPDIPYSMAQYADDAVHLLDALGWDRCHVVGYSFGGMVVQEFALRHPGRVDRLVIAGASSGGAGGSSFPMERFAGMEQEAMLSLRIATSDVRRDKAWQEANPGEYEVLREHALAAVQFGAGEPGRETGARRQLEARARHDTFNRLPQLQMPVLVCAGRYDGIAPPDCAQNMARQIPGAELSLFDDGHYFLHSLPEAKRKVMEFLKGD